MPAATVTIETRTSTDIITTISCKPTLSDGAGFHWYLYHLHRSKKKTPNHKYLGFFWPPNVKQEFYDWHFKIFFTNCNIQILIGDISQGWYLQLST